MRIAYSPTLGYARPDPEVVKLTDRAAQTFEQLGCHVDLVESVFDNDPADLWTAEFYAGVGIRLRSFMENQRDLSIRLWPMSLSRRCRRKCAITTPRFSPATRCATSSAFFERTTS